MDFIRNLTGLFLPLLSFIALWLYIHTFRKEWRDSFISASVYFCFFVFIFMEFLSFFNALQYLFVLCGYIVFLLTMLLLVILRMKKSAFKLELFRLSSPGWEYMFFGIIFFFTFFIALAYPPNSWDSMSYHLPRIEQWIQNKNLNHFRTMYFGQILQGPFAETLMLQGRILSGDDWLMNLVQWFAFAGTAIVISRIAFHLGLNKKLQITASLFFIVLPMTVFQATNTKTDMVESLFICCLAERFLLWNKNNKLYLSIDFGITLGLAILTKGTAYPIAFPFVFLFAKKTIKNFKKLFPGACLAAVLGLTIIMPFSIRNYVEFKDPIGLNRGDGMASNGSVKAFIIIFASDVFTNIMPPLPQKLRDTVNLTLNKVWFKLKVGAGNGVGDGIFVAGTPTARSFNTFFSHSFDENHVQHFFQMIILIVFFFAYLFCPDKKDRKDYFWIVFGCWCMFAFCIPWNPWINRQQLPLMALSAPFFAEMFEIRRFSRYRKAICIFLGCLALFPLFLNRLRPLIPVVKIVGEKSIWNTTREELFFKHKLSLYQKYLDACAALGDTNRIGLLFNADTWEYPLWRFLRKNRDDMPTVQHIKIGDPIPDYIDTLFVMNRSDLDFMPPLNESLLQPDNPLVLKRDNTNRWEMVFPLLEEQEKLF
jgi:4-amino-4-deoxy-L-arabinose transferase-like glycosyltransferase